jgi:hypothetical protein
MEIKEIIEYITRLIFDDVFTIFIKEVKKQSNKQIKEQIFIVKAIKRYLVKSNAVQKGGCKLDIMNKIAKETTEYFKNNMQKILKKFLDTRHEYAIISDSIDAAVFLKLFDNIKESCYAHTFQSKQKDFSLSEYKKEKIFNINKNRLATTPEEAYPENDRPRGPDDLASVDFHRKILQSGKELDPIWLIEINGKKYILDGFHRLAASSIEKKKTIKCFEIKI